MSGQQRVNAPSAIGSASTAESSNTVDGKAGGSGPSSGKDWSQASAWRDMDARSAPFTVPSHRETSPTASFLAAAQQSSSPPFKPESTPSSSSQSYTRYASPQSGDARSPSPSRRPPFAFAPTEARDRWSSIGQAQQHGFGPPHSEAGSQSQQPQQQQQQQQPSSQQHSQHQPQAPQSQPPQSSQQQHQHSQQRKGLSSTPFGGEHFLGYTDIWGSSGGQRSQDSDLRAGHPPSGPGRTSTSGGSSGNGVASLDNINTRLEGVGIGRDESGPAFGAGSMMNGGPIRPSGQEGGVLGGGGGPFAPLSSIPSSGSLSPRSLLQYHQQQMQTQQHLSAQAQGMPAPPPLPPMGGPQSGGMSAMSSGLDGSRNGEEITTVFIVGFPDDMTEREFANMFLFAKGFEASTLKIPPGIVPSGPLSGVRPGGGSDNAGAGPGGPYNAVNMPGAGLFDQAGGGGGAWDEHAGMSMTGMPRGSVAESFGERGGMPLGALAGPSGKIKQIIGFAKFRTRAEALEARDALNGRKIDAERGCVLKTEMAKKNLHTKQRPVLSNAGGQDGGSIGPSFVPPPPPQSMGPPHGGFGPPGNIPLAHGQPPPHGPPGIGAAGGGPHGHPPPGLHDGGPSGGGAGSFAGQHRASRQHDGHPQAGGIGLAQAPPFGVFAGGHMSGPAAGGHHHHGSGGQANFDPFQPPLGMHGPNGIASPSEASAPYGNRGAARPYGGQGGGGESMPQYQQYQSAGGSGSIMTSSSGSGADKWAGMGPIDYFDVGQQQQKQPPLQQQQIHQQQSRQPPQGVSSGVGTSSGNNSASSGGPGSRGPDWSTLSSPPGLFAGAKPITFGEVQATTTRGDAGSVENLQKLEDFHKGESTAYNVQRQVLSPPPQPPSLGSEKNKNNVAATKNDIGARATHDNDQSTAAAAKEAKLENGNTNSGSNAAIHSTTGANGTAPQPPLMAAPVAAHAGHGAAPVLAALQGAAAAAAAGQPAGARPLSRVSTRATSPPVGGGGTSSRFGSLRIDSPIQHNNNHNHTRPFSPHAVMRSPPPYLDGNAVGGSLAHFRATSPGSPPISSPTSRSFSIDANPPGNTLFVGNLPASITAPPASAQLEEALYKVFSTKSGFRQMSFRVKTSGPMCFIEFDDVGCAGRALGQLNGDTLDGIVKGGLRLSFSKHPLFKGTTSSSSTSGALTPSTTPTPGGEQAVGSTTRMRVGSPPGR